MRRLIFFIILFVTIISVAWFLFKYYLPQSSRRQQLEEYKIASEKLEKLNQTKTSLLSLLTLDPNQADFYFQLEKRVSLLKNSEDTFLGTASAALVSRLSPFERLFSYQPLETYKKYGLQQSQLDLKAINILPSTPHTNKTITSLSTCEDNQACIIAIQQFKNAIFQDEIKAILPQLDQTWSQLESNRVSLQQRVWELELALFPR